MFNRNFGLLATLLLLLSLFTIGEIESHDWKNKLDPSLRSKIDQVSILSDEIEVIVKTKDSSVLDGHESVDLENIPWSTAKISIGDLQGIAKNPNVEYIQMSKPVSLFLQQSRSLIGADVANNYQFFGSNLTGKNIGVCIIDTGVNYNHADLGGGFGPGFKVVGGYDFYNRDTDPIDDHGHGTHVAGIVGANGSITGVAPGVNIIAMKVLSQSGIGSFTDVDLAIDWCISNSSVYNISIISMSLGAGLYSSICDSDYPSTAALVDQAVAKNITVIAATGNDGSVSRISSPACISNVTPVGATYDAGSNVDKITSFSNRNSLTSLVAPGHLINSTWITGYAQAFGTSMSAPHVAGAFALYVQKHLIVYNTSALPSDIVSVFNSTGVVVNDSASNLTFRRINVSAAVQSIATDLTLLNIDAPQNNSAIGGNYTFVASVGTNEVAANTTFYFSNSTGTFIACSNSTRGAKFSCTWDTALAGESAINITANATNGTVTVTNSSFNITIDNIFPEYSNNGTNQSQTYVGEPVAFFALWNDTYLSHAKLRLYENGSSRNISMSFNGSNWSNFTWSNNTLRAGNIINWSIEANDSAGNANTSMPFGSFVLWDRANLSNYSYSPNSPTTNDNVNISCKVSDSYLRPVLGYQVSFFVSNQTTNATTGSDGFATIQRTFTEGQHSVSCSIEANATSYYNVSNTNLNWTITVSAPAPQPAPPSGGGSGSGGSSGSSSSGGGGGGGAPRITQNETKNTTVNDAKKVELEQLANNLGLDAKTQEEKDLLNKATILIAVGDYQGAESLLNQLKSSIESPKQSVTANVIRTYLPEKILGMMQSFIGILASILNIF